MKNNIESYWVWIYLSGSREVIEHVCREYCMRGLCVTVEEVKYIYTGGEEIGVRVGLINYPRFPVEETKVWEIAIELAEMLKDRSFQQSVLVMDKHKTLWISDRENL